MRDNKLMMETENLLTWDTGQYPIVEYTVQTGIDIILIRKSAVAKETIK